MRICGSCGEEYTYRPPCECRGVNYNGWRGWCPRCYNRWLDHHKPASGPPPPRQGAGGGPHPGRFEDYEWLRRDQHHSPAEAALRLGVTRRTAQRYEARLTSSTTASERAA